MATIGQVIPEGTFQAFHEQEIRPITLESYRGRWVVLVFYPGDFTFICPTELEELGALYADFRKVGAEVIGVSTDSVYVHKAWHDTSPSIKKLAFPLLADSGGLLSQKLGVYLYREGVALRGSFIFDPDGKLCAYEVHANNIGRNMERASAQASSGGLRARKRRSRSVPRRMEARRPHAKTEPRFGGQAMR